MDMVISPLNEAAYQRYEAALQGIRIPPPRRATSEIEVSNVALGDFANSVSEMMQVRSK